MARCCTCKSRRCPYELVLAQQQSRSAGLDSPLRGDREPGAYRKGRTAMVDALVMQTAAAKPISGRSRLFGS